MTADGPPVRQGIARHDGDWVRWSIDARGVLDVQPALHDDLLLHFGMLNALNDLDAEDDRALAGFADAERALQRLSGYLIGEGFANVVLYRRSDVDGPRFEWFDLSEDGAVRSEGKS